MNNFDEWYKDNATDYALDYDTAGLVWDYQQQGIDHAETEVTRYKYILSRQKDVLDRQNKRLEYYIETNAALQQALQDYRDKE